MSIVEQHTEVGKKIDTRIDNSKKSSSTTNNYCPQGTIDGYKEQITAHKEQISHLQRRYDEVIDSSRQAQKEAKKDYNQVVGIFLVLVFLLVLFYSWRGKKKDDECQTHHIDTRELEKYKKLKGD